jgi:hypothetical protein
MLGVDNLKKLITVGLEVPKVIADITADGKVTFIELFNVLPIATDLIGVVKSYKEIAAEFADLDDTEREELHTFFAEKFDIPNDLVEAYVEDALEVAFNLISLVARFKTLKNPPPVV